MDKALPPDDHACGWREYALQLHTDLEQLKAEFATLKRGHRSEKLPPMSREVRRGRPADPAETRCKRKERAVAKSRLQTETVDVKVPSRTLTALRQWAHDITRLDERHLRPLPPAAADRRPCGPWARYRATRPKVERKIAHLMRRDHGGRRARVRAVGGRSDEELRPLMRHSPKVSERAGRGILLSPLPPGCPRDVGERARAPTVGDAWISPFFAARSVISLPPAENSIRTTDY